MRIYRLTLDEVRKYRNDRMVDVTRARLSEVIDNFDDWVVTVTKYDNIDDNYGWQYVITFKNIMRGEYNNDLENRFNYEYFLSLFNNLHEHNILTPAQIKWYIDNTNILAETKDRLRRYCNAGYSWECDFLLNDSEYAWQLDVIALDENSVPAYLYTDKLVFNFGKNLLSIQESFNSCESNQVSETSEPAVEKVVDDVRSNSDVWYLSKRQLRDYYDNMSSYSRKVETAIHDYDNYCVRIEKADDVYTLIIDKMQPDIARNFYVATIDRHMFNTILGINSDEDACDCDSDAEEIDDDEEVIWEGESTSNEEVEDRPMSEDPDSLFTVVDGQLRRLLLQDEFNRFRSKLICPSYAVENIHDYYDSFNVFIIKDDASHYSIIADRIYPYDPSYYKNGFTGDDCLAHYFGQDFVDKFNEVYEEHNCNINTSDESAYPLSMDEFKKYVDYLSPLNASLLNDVLDNYYVTYTAIINKNTDLTYAYRLSISGGLITYFDNIPEQIMPTVFGEDTAHKIEEYFNTLHCTELVGRALDNLRVPTVDNRVNDFRVNDHYHRYLTKDEFERYASRIRFGSMCHSQIDNILNHYENYIVYISKETTDGGSPYKLNVIDMTTNELFYWDGFSDTALINCFGADVARDVDALDPVRVSNNGSTADEIQPGRHLVTFSDDSISLTPRELFAAQYMQNTAVVNVAADTPTSNNAGEEEPVSDEIRTIDQLVVALDKLRQQRITQLDDHNVAYASNMNRHEQYDYDDHVFNDNLLVNIDNLINSLNRMREREEV